MQKVLIIYSSVDGHTLKICSRIKQQIEKQNDLVTLLSVNEANSVEVTAFDKIVIGASIHYGKHSKEIYHFIKQHAQVLATLPNAFFSVNLVARKPEKSSPDSNPYVKKFLKQITWKPQHLSIFAGKIDYQKYSFWDRQIIRLIMWMTKGPTDPKANIDFTNWTEVENFAQVINEM